MKKYPLVSILIPVFQRGELSKEAIESALAQDYPNFEIIISDNCSTDGSYEMLCKAYANNSNIQIFQNAENLGAVENWKKCLEKAKGEYIKFLWSDDLMRYDFISKSVQLLENNPEASFAYSAVKMFRDSCESEIVVNKNSNKSVCTLKFFGEKHNKEILYRSGRTKEYSSKKFLDKVYKSMYKIPVSPGCAIFRRENLHIIDEIPNCFGYVHKRNGAGPDLLMFLEAIKNREKYIYIDEPMNYFREHAESISCSDETILIGYETAKQYYLRENGLKNYLPWFNAYLLVNKSGFSFLNYKSNDEILLKYYTEIRQTIHGKQLLPYIFAVKLKAKLYIQTIHFRKYVIKL